MERLGQNYGFVCYRFTAGTGGPVRLSVPGIRDRGQVLVDGIERGLLEREHDLTSIVLDIPGPGARVDLLVENQGRVNYGPGLADAKGILGDIELGDRPVRDLTIYPLPLDNLDRLDLAAAPAVTEVELSCPVLCAGWFDIAEIADGYLELAGWTKGVVWVNGFNLGRYWDRGPTRRLYLPGPLLRTGRNELCVLELHRVRRPTVLLTGQPDLGP
jgi:beta-galactosidase